MRLRQFLGCFALIMVFALGDVQAKAAMADLESFSVLDDKGAVLAKFTIGELKSKFDFETRQTSTPWYGEQIVFQGPLLKDVLSRSGVTDYRAVQLIAFDDFVSEIRLDEIEDYAPILAVERQCTQGDRYGGLCAHGEEFRAITMEERGPVFLVWPLDKLPAAYVPARNSIWVWFAVSARPVR